MYPFIINQQYRRKDIYSIIGIPEDTKGGNWDTGYNEFNNDFFLFCNVGIPGRTGHDYDNRFVGDDLYWHAKNNTNIEQPQIQRLLNPSGYVYIFYRTDSSFPFTYAGTGIPKSSQSTIPVQITWELSNNDSEIPQAVNEYKHLWVGALKTVKVNIFERNPVARKICLENKGYKCSICGFDFQKIYGELGKKYMHVHFVRPLGEVRNEHEIDPVKDLEPVCPNCHAMLHKKRPAMSIEELKDIVNNR